MRTSLQRIDEILARVPADSRIGREVHAEVTTHLEESLASKVAQGAGYDDALEAALDDFGESRELERVYYRDYVAQRYLWGVFDREAWRDGRWLRDLGAALVLLGIVLYQLLPTVGAHVGALSIAMAQANGLGGKPDLVRAVVDTASERALPFALDPRVEGIRVWSVLTGIGVLLLAHGGARSLRRLRLPATAADFALIAGVALAGFLSILLTTDPSGYADAFVSSLYETEGDVSIDALDAWGRFAMFGSVLLVALAGWVFLRAGKAGVADTFLLRRGAANLLLMVAALYLLSHPELRAALPQMAEDANAFPPARLLQMLRSDLLLFVAGALLSGWAVLGLRRTFAEADRVFRARTSD